MVDTPTMYASPFDTTCKVQYGDHSYVMNYVSGDLSDPADQAELIALYTIDNANNMITGLAADRKFIGAHTLTLTGKNADKFDSYTSPNFVFTIVDPCLVTTLNPTDADNDAIAMLDMTSTVKASRAENQYFDEMKDSTSKTYGDGYDRCGPRSYTILDTDGKEVSVGRYFDAVKLFQVTATEEDQVGTYNMVLTGTLDWYVGTVAPANVPFTVTIDECVIGDWSMDELDDQVYYISKNSLNLKWSVYQTPCEYIETYNVV